MRIEGLSQLQTKLKAFPDKVKAELAKASQDAANEWAGLAKKDAAANGDTGTLVRNISAKQIDEFNWAVVSSAKYAGYIEFGTKGNYRAIPGTEEIAAELKANKQPGTIDDFLLNIVDWVHRKGIAGRFSVKTKKRLGNKNEQLQEDYEVAFVIMMSILKHGIKPHPYFFKQRAIVEPKFLASVKAIIQSTLK